MKRMLFLMAGCMLCYACSFGATRYWTGPVNGNWNNPANWSAASGGTGGASVPASADTVMINVNSMILLDASPTVSSLMVTSGTNVTLYTATPAVLTILNNMQIGLVSVLKDSTSTNVPFNVVFNGATHATCNVAGQWIFAGDVPVSTGAGAAFTAQPGSMVRVFNIAFSLITFNRLGPAIVFRNNTGTITSDPSTLVFAFNTGYILDHNMDASIPDATWANDSIAGPEYSGFLGASASTILVSGNMGRLRHLAVHPVYGNIILDLPALGADASFALPDNTSIRSNLTVSNTNNQVLTLLASEGANKRIMVNVGSEHYYTGSLFITGNTTKVALATSITANPAMAYRIHLNNDFSQKGGLFYMQGNADSPDSSTLSIARDLVQTQGTFAAGNNTASAAPYTIEMNGPDFIDYPVGIVTQSQIINMKGTIIPATGIHTTLRIAQTLSNSLDPNNSNVNINKGVSLQSPVQTGRLALIKGTLYTTDTSVLTVTGSDAAAVVVTGTSGESYVTGPVVRYTNSSNAYLFPAGRGVSRTSPSDAYYHPCSVMPAAVVAGAYRVNYFNTSYPDVRAIFPLKGVSNKEYWDVRSIAGPDAGVLLSLKGAVAGATVADAIVVAHYANGSWLSVPGTAVTPGNATLGMPVSFPLSASGPFTLGYEDAAATLFVTADCPKDTIVIAGAIPCNARVTWTAPNAMFPQTIGVPHGVYRSNALLNFKGMFNGHGYYESDDEYQWPDARSAAAGAGGHLITITTAAEDSFVYSHINERFNYAWIGLYNTGTVGSFGWVTGEPLGYSNWIPGQPDNLWHDPAFVHEPYVHINGWADSLCRWNDNGADVNAKFIAEFDTPILTYRQISGPGNGDSLTAGVYLVCYEKTNAASGAKDTCCFTITVICGAITFIDPAAGVTARNINNKGHHLSAVALSNVGPAGFPVNVSSNTTEKASTRLTEMPGRIIALHYNLYDYIVYLTVRV